MNFAKNLFIGRKKKTHRNINSIPINNCANGIFIKIMETLFTGSKNNCVVM